MMGLYFDEIETGRVDQLGSYEFTRESVLKFARAYDPQTFHLSDEAAAKSHFGKLAASGWHTAAVTMKLMTSGPFRPAGGNIGARLEELRWPQPTRPGDELRVETEVLEARPSESRPGFGWLKVRTTTFNQKNEVVQSYVANVIVLSRAAA